MRLWKHGKKSFIAFIKYSSKIIRQLKENVDFFTSSINITFIRKYTPCSLSTELRALKYITVINLSISKIIKFITNIKKIKLLKEKIRLHLKNLKCTNSKKMTNNERLLVTICFANWNIKCSIIPQFSTFRPWWKQSS